MGLLRNQSGQFKKWHSITMIHLSLNLTKEAGV